MPFVPEAVTPVLPVLDIMFLALVIPNALFAYLFEHYDREISPPPTRRFMRWIFTISNTTDPRTIQNVQLKMYD